MVQNKSVYIWAVGILIVCLLGMGLTNILNQQKLKSQLNQVEKDWIMLHKAMQSFGMDRCGVYNPADTMARRKLDPTFPLTFETDQDFIKTQPVGVDSTPVNIYDPLTTPIAYMNELPMDPFNPGHFYRYTCWTVHDKTINMYFIHSPGPDREVDLSLEKLRDVLEPYWRKRGCTSQSQYLLICEKSMLKRMILPYLYDPTNGLTSRGDLIRFYSFDTPFGFRESTWTEAPEDDKHIYDKMLNEPATMESWIILSENLLSNHQDTKQIILKGSMIETLQKAGIQLQPQNHFSNDSVFTILEPLFNHLDKDFKNVIQHPRKLNEQELNALAQWKKESPVWWHALESKPNESLGDKSYPINAVSAIYPIYGKSLYLLAAEAYAHNDKVSCRYYLNRISTESSVITPSMRITHSQLERIRSEFERLTSSLGLELQGYHVM